MQTSPRHGPVRVLFVPSSEGVGDWVGSTFPAGRFVLSFGNDALTIVASACAQEADLIVVDTPTSVLDVDSMLASLRDQGSRTAVVVVSEAVRFDRAGAGFPLRVVRGPPDPEALRAEIDSALEEAASLPPRASGAIGPDRGGADRKPDGPIIDASGFATALADAGVSAPPRPPPLPRRRAPDAAGPPAGPPRAGGDGVVLERAVSAQQGEGPPANPRVAMFVNDDAASAPRIGGLLRGAGWTVRALGWAECDTLDPIRRIPPSILIAGIESEADGERFVKEIRLDARLRNVPLLVLSSKMSVLDTIRLMPPPSVEVLRRDVPEREILSNVAAQLAPFEQTRERIAAEKVASGEIAPLGAAAIIVMAAEVRPGSHVVFRGDGRLFEVDLDGRFITGVSLTEPDGRHIADVDALIPLVALRFGRYSVRSSGDAPSPPTSLRLPVPEALWEAEDRLTDLLRCSTPIRIVRMERVRFREPFGAVRGLSPAEVRARARLQDGATPRSVAGAPGMTVESVGKLIEKLILAGEVVSLDGPHLIPAPPSSEAPASPTDRPPAEPYGDTTWKVDPEADTRRRGAVPTVKRPDVPYPGKPAADQPAEPYGDTTWKVDPEADTRRRGAVPTVKRPDVPFPAPAAERSGTTAPVTAGVLRRDGADSESRRRAVAETMAAPRGVTVADPTRSRTEVSAVSALFSEVTGIPEASPQPVSIPPPPFEQGDRRSGDVRPKETPAAAARDPEPAPAPSPGDVRPHVLPPPPPGARQPGPAGSPDSRPVPPLPSSMRRSAPGAPASVEPVRAAPDGGGRKKRTGLLGGLVVVLCLALAGVAYLLWSRYGREEPSAGQQAAGDAGALVAAAPADVSKAPATPDPPDAAAEPAGDAGGEPPAAADADEAAAEPAEDAGGEPPEAVDADEAAAEPAGDAGGEPPEAVDADEAAAEPAGDAAGPPDEAPAEATPDAAAEPAGPDAVASVPDVGTARDTGARQPVREAALAVDAGAGAAGRDAAEQPDRVAREAEVREPSPSIPEGRALLVIPQPEGVSAEIRITVDGTSRGTAPAQIELAAGEHEVRFEASGQTSLSLVRLSSGERKVLVPRQLVRLLTGGAP